MNTGQPPDIDPQRLAYVLTTVHAQIVTALWLSAGMLLAMAAIVSMALRCRRTSLIFGLGYSATLFFVDNGYSLILGPIGCAVSLIALVWPEPSRARRLQSAEPPPS
jgi:hypothetical protein